MAVPAGADYSPVSIGVITEKSIKENRLRVRQERSFCRKAQKAKGQIAKLGSLKKLSFDQRYDYTYLLETGEQGCPKDLNLAVGLAEKLLDGPLTIESRADYMVRLQHLLKLRGQSEDLVRVEELARILFVRGYYASSEVIGPKWTPAERIAFVSRDDIWEYLTHRPTQDVNLDNLLIEAWLDPQSPRFDPRAALSMLENSKSAYNWVRAASVLLDGRVVPADPARAEALLWKAAQFDDNAKLILLEVLQPRLASKDSGVRGPIIKRLLPWVQSGQPLLAAVRERLAIVLLPELAVPDPLEQRDAAQALTALAIAGASGVFPPLLDWIDTVLRTRNDSRQNEARSMLARMVTANFAPARTVLYQELTRHGGLVEAGDWTPDPAKPTSFDRYLTTNDYPTRALREERSGVVRATAVFGPDGKVLLIEITGSSGHADLDQAVRSVLQRRMRRSWPEYPGRYVRAKLPPIQFRIQSCDNDGPMTKPIEEAVLVDGRRCFQTLIQDTPVV